jgi:hypothetical protein
MRIRPHLASRMVLGTAEDLLRSLFLQSSGRAVELVQRRIRFSILPRIDNLTRR